MIPDQIANQKKNSVIDFFLTFACFRLANQIQNTYLLTYLLTIIIIIIIKNKTTSTSHFFYPTTKPREKITLREKRVEKKSG